MKLLYYNIFEQNKDNNVNTPNNTDNLANIKELNKDFKKANKIEPPEVSLANITPIDILDYDTFNKKQEEENKLTLLNNTI